MIREKKGKRELILDTAYELLLNKGFRATKIIDISELAGIGKGTVYEYFDSKDEIFYELFKTKGADPYQDLPRLIGQEKTGEDKIKAYVAFELDHIAAFGFDMNLLIGTFIKTDPFQNPALTDEIQKLMGFKISMVCHILEEGIKKCEFLPVNPLLAATSIMGSISFFANLNFDPIPPAYFIDIEKNGFWNREEFYKLLFQGLKK